MKTVTVHPGPESLPPRFDALFAEAAGRDGIFHSLTWYRNLCATAFEDRAARFYTVEDRDGKPMLILPMCHETTRAGWLSPHRLAAAANFYSSLFGPIGGTTEDIACAIRAICREQPRWDIVDLHPMSPDAPQFAAIAQTLRQAGMAVQRYYCFGNWYLEVAGRSYREYFEGLPSRLKNTVVRKSRRLAGRLEIRMYPEQGALEEGMAAYRHVYGASWKTPEPFEGFMPGLMQTCAQTGWLRLGIAYVDGQPAAAQVWITANRVASIYKLAYDERHERLSIGSILTDAMMRHAIDVDGVREVDYLTGDEPYKRDWMEQRRERWGIVAFNLRTWRGMLGAVRHLGAAELKNLVGGVGARGQGLARTRE